jgi:DNA topoisomerase II
MSKTYKFKPKTNKNTNDSSIVKLDHKTHILKLPDTYIGSIEQTLEQLWCIDRNNEDGIHFIKKEIKYIPGKYKIFDEIIVNALDQYIRTNENNGCKDKVKNIKITIDKDTGEISVYNDGEGIKIDIHPTEKVYNPELIFGHLLTSTNYNENQLKHVGGKNGYGAKLTNIFSTKFLIDTCDGNKLYSQTFQNNMSIKNDPIITKNRTKQFTKISYIPDFKKFNITGLTDDIINIMEKRAYDMAACTNQASIYLNGTKINCNSFEKYIDYYIGSKSDTPRAFEIVNNRWSIGVALNTDEYFDSISFVNGINTIKGGKHVDYILNQITKKMVEFISKKKKITLKPNFIKDNLFLFINCTIDNPSFNSQTKEFMTTNKDKFGSKCIITDKFITQMSKIGIIERALEQYELKNSKNLKKNDGKKQNRLKGIPKLEDANFAGTKKSNQCTLILTEGDSAKSMAMAGMSIIGRDKYGVFPLKGKILNVKDISNVKKIMDNSEISNIKKILGLQSNKIYKDVSELRYGNILVLTDQDEDGSHIKGLLFNLFESLWPTLFNSPGFIKSMLTPVIKIRKGGKEKQFYSVKDYDKWILKNDTKGWTTKYYKGLGTSTPKEAKEYFKQLKIVDYTTTGEEDLKALNMAFSKQENSANERKTWLSTYNKNNTLDYSNKNVSINNFVNQDLKHFSNSDNIRSIPNIIDGLKPSQRKVLYCCIKRKLDKEIRVAQLAGYVSEHGAYHHGEASLQGTIINMAQDYVGSNNINLLDPIGQFGTRIMGGKDSAQPRYIHTKLCGITHKLFNKLDNSVYNYNNDDGISIEPIYYVPILPMILINGAVGIGTGWSTDIPNFNPFDILVNIKNYLNDKPFNIMKPYYNKFKGPIEKIDDNIYISKGIYEVHKNKLIIKELPIGMWTDNYKNFLESITVDNKNGSKKQLIRYYNSYSTDIDVHFEIFVNMDEDDFNDLKVFDNKLKMTKLEKMFKLTTNINLTNMVLFDKDNNIKKYNNVNEILDEFIGIRLEYYDKRKHYILDVLDKEINILEIKIRFIMEFIENKIIINNRTKINIIEQLETNKYPKDSESDNYDYLLKMPIYNLTKDKIDEFNDLLNKKKNEYETLKVKTNKILWLEDLDILEKDLKSYKKKPFKFKINN